MRGHVLLGNHEGLIVGHTSEKFWLEHAEARRDLQRAFIEDAGHTLGSAPQALKVAADGLAQSVLIRDSAFAKLADHGGPLTSAGRARRAFAVWSASLDKTERHLRLLGPNT